MNPLTLRAGAALVALAFAFGAGWQVQGWRLKTAIAVAKADRANETAQRAEVALTDLTEAAKKINEAAGGARTDFDAVLVKLSAIDRRYRNAKPPPLPVDCKPDAVRVQRLTEAAGAANEAIARPVAGR